MYRGRGAGRWAESSSGARVLPYKPPACVRTAAKGDEAVVTKSLPELALPCIRRRGALPPLAGLPGAPEDAPVSGGPPLVAPRRCSPPPWAGHTPRPCDVPLHPVWGEAVTS